MSQYCPVLRIYGHHGCGKECAGCDCNPKERPNDKNNQGVHEGF